MGPRKPDTRHLEKPKPFVHGDIDAELREWPEYRFQLVNLLVTLDPGFAEELERVDAAREDELGITTTQPGARERAIQLYSFSAGLLWCRLLAQARGVPQRDGLEAWRRILNTMEPVERGRSLRLLQRRLSNAYWSAGQDFQTQLL